MPIEEYCSRHTVVPMLGVPSIGATSGVEWTYQLQPARPAHVRQVGGSYLREHGINASERSYRARFDSDPGLDTRHMLLFVNEMIYLQIDYVTVVRDGSGTPIMWVAFANEKESRQDP